MFKINYTIAFHGISVNCILTKDNLVSHKNFYRGEDDRCLKWLSLGMFLNNSKTPKDDKMKFCQVNLRVI